VLQRGKGKGAESYQYVKRSEDGRVGSERRGPGVDDDGVVGGGDDGKDDEVPEAAQARNGFTCRQQFIGGRGEGDGSTEGTGLGVLLLRLREAVGPSPMNE
jgi:hypothetical protein